MELCDILCKSVRFDKFLVYRGFTYEKGLKEDGHSIIHARIQKISSEGSNSAR